MRKIFISLCCIVVSFFSYTLSASAELVLPGAVDIYDINQYQPLPYSTITQARVYYDNNGSSVYKDANYNQQTGIYHTYTENIGFVLNQVQYRFRMNTTEYLNLSSDSIYCITFHGQEFTQLIGFEALTSEIGSNVTTYDNFELYTIEDNTYQLFFIPESDVQVYYLNLYFNCYSETVFLENINYPGQGYTLYELVLTDEIINQINTSNQFKEVVNKLDEVNDTLTNGNSESQSVSDRLDDVTDDFSNAVDDFNNLDEQYNQMLEDNLNSIDLSQFDIGGITQLASASLFVRTQFDNLTVGNPFGTLMGFSLVVGLALLLMGKRL